MSCDEGARRLTRYLDGTLDLPGRRQFEQHLEACADCRLELDLWIRLEGTPEPQPSQALRTDFHSALTAEVLTPQQRPAPRVPWFAYAAAALLLLGAGWTLGRYAGPAPQQPASELTALRQEVGSLRSMVALSLLAQESASARLKGISYAGHLQGDTRDVLGALVSALRFDSNVNVRLAACDALRAYRAEPAARRAFADALTAEESPLVKVTLIEALADFGDRESVRPLLRLRAAEGEDSSVREGAARALDRMKLKGIKWE